MKIKLLLNRFGPVLILTFAVVLSLFNVPSIGAIDDMDNVPYTLGAHRGNSVEHIENTYEAIKASLEDEQYKFIEFDIQYTKDKEIVLFHDLTLLRLQNNKAKIADLTYTELQEISKFPIATYDEIMDLVAGKKKLNIEIKSQGNLEDDQEIVDYVMKDIKKRNIEKEVILSAISKDVVKYVDQTYPEMKVGKIYWITRSTYFHPNFFTKQMYKNLQEMGADYVMLHGVNILNYKDLIEHKPDDISLVFWYFNDQMYLVHNTENDKMW